jgi:hypothetical protein
VSVLRSLAAICAAAAGCTETHARAEPAETVPRVTAGLMKKAPVVDGNIGQDEWSGAVRNVGFAGHGSDVLTDRQGVFWIGCDAESLFIAVRSEQPPGTRILTRAVPHPRRDVKAAFFDDSIELVLDPKRARPAGEDRTYYHIITNARGALYDRAIDPDNAQNPMNVAWRVEGLRLQSTQSDAWWDVEIAIPLASLGVTKQDLGRPWGLRVARNWRRPGQQSQWSAKAGNYLHQPTMPVVVWKPGAAVVQILSLCDDAGAAHIVLSVRNPAAEPRPVRVRLSDAWHHNPPRELDTVLRIAPGAIETVELAPPDGGPEGLHNTDIRITDADGDTLYYARSCRWSLEQPDDRWSVTEQQQDAVKILFSYYPYHSKIRFRIDVSALDARDAVTGAATAVFRADADGQPDGEPLWTSETALTSFAAEQTCDIPELEDGRYCFTVRLSGRPGIPGDVSIQPFVRQHFEWEHNRLGTSTEVMPPFTPLTVRARTVGCVLREHEQGETGLWNAVRSQERSLLTRPMSWEIAAGDNDARHPVVDAPWHVTEQSDTRVAGEATWHCGNVRAAVRTDYDYDGMMLTTLTLEGGRDTDVKALTLNIPIVEKEARYMHAVGDGLRHNYAGFVPAGNGRIWDSAKANKVDLVGTFYPYLWVGGGERGVCWFADSDRGWSLDQETPVIDLTRNQGELLVRVHFVTETVRLDEPRTLVFGLQVTPTKPMPEGWRRWTGRIDVPGARPVSWMGSTYYWGGISYDIYPYKKHFEYWKELRRARETGDVNQDFLARWMNLIEEWHPNDGKGYEAHGYEFIRRHLHAGFRAASSATWNRGHRLFGYTNARGIGFSAPEFATFQDEWLRYGWFDRSWNERGGVGYDVSPSDSFVDFALWYYRKMLMWTDGVYWDNMFLSAHRDPVVGNAWVDDGGEIHPGLGLFHLRNLVKRTAIMHWQESRNMPAHRLPLVSLSHMTNTMIVPILSFGNCNMDWEWKYGYEDFQDRFSADLTVAETLGRQVGAWPTILAGGHPDPKDPRTARMWRTRLAVCLVHEIQNFDYRPAEEAELYAKLFEFGYGLPECTVFNYWDEPHPVAVEGVDARTLAMTCGNKALVIVTSYGDDGVAEANVDNARLGIPMPRTVTDFETGESVDMSTSGEIRFPLKKHDFRIIKLE